ncbi:SDR family oxidoreductase [Streptomyces iranensis]|uniref:NAD(P)-dependent dehydrogenase (Short-subunit alcohol dehydrogenase family) n=1 Tax=Streptomyces iranensis TaxID=576784 RepID=A0A061A836_9ACTN|nr:SDR family oxidoreductase [Streptomyces iranensis]MBP2068122.1 NAD(P)-dependent dehydrogenase (short-subunit alcohol dehydrogenase family) [Streptomyces iranensis]CDR13603.1 short-chain dehydrogenase/reductase SDR [Streptomyces iranensis]
MEKYNGKRALVTGGSSGIGLSIARLLAAEGAQVMVTGRKEAALEAASKEGLVAVGSDVGSKADIDALAGKAEEAFGQLDAVFLNAGITDSTSFEATTEQMYDAIFAVNTKGPYFTLQRLLPLLAEGSGVVLTTSVSNVLGQLDHGVYAASKAALRSMARTWARELLPRGVRVNAVSPGPIDTGILYKNLPAEVADEMLAGYAAQIPMLRTGNPEEVARAAIFLAFDATYTTGAELAVDGGGTQL